MPITIPAGHTAGTPLPTAPLERGIRQTCQDLADFLVDKNRAYGNSAGEPVRVFARRVDRLAQIDVRIDDKLSRLKKGSEFPGDDTVKDLAGYLILRMVVAGMLNRQDQRTSEASSDVSTCWADLPKSGNQP
jgi:hypothetical protein